MSDNNPYNVKTELTDGIDSMAQFSGADGQILPQRQALHELITQAVSERKVIIDQKLDYQDYLKKIIDDAKATPSFQSIKKTVTTLPKKYQIFSTK